MNQSLDQFRFNGKAIPEYMHGGIRRYLDDRIPPGDFLMAVLCNDLREACGRADDENINLLPVYIAYFYNEAPASCWGSLEKVERWLMKKESA